MNTMIETAKDLWKNHRKAVIGGAVVIIILVIAAF